MKKSLEILGLPIISISDGIEVGRVKNIIINACKGSIDYLVVDSGIQILSARIIPTNNILGIGEYAVTIENEEAINDLGKIPAAIDLLQKNIQVKGTKVLTKKGRLIGEIGDIYVDETDNCKIIGLEYIADITHKKIRLIARESVITFGSNLVIVEEDIEDKLLENAIELSGRVSDDEKKNVANSFDLIKTKADIFSEVREKPKRESRFEPKNEMKEVKLVLEEEPELLDDEVMEEIFEETDLQQEMEDEIQESPMVATSTEEEKKNTAASLFEQRQKQYLNGRKATKTITDNGGDIIIQEGKVISAEIIEIAKNSGKLIELVMNNKA